MLHQVVRRHLERFLDETASATDGARLAHWADGYLAVASSHARSARVWTYDREFRTIWRRPDGTRIPLAVAPE